MTNTKNLFVSHSWSYSNAYERLILLLNDNPYFKYRNYSVPKNNPLHTNGNDKQLYEAIKKQIKPASVVLILAGVYSTYSEWINKEIKIAKELNKSIIAIEPWGADKTSQIVKDNANLVVRWNAKSIINAINELT